MDVNRRAQHEDLFDLISRVRYSRHGDGSTSTSNIDLRGIFATKETKEGLLYFAQRSISHIKMKNTEYEARELTSRSQKYYCSRKSTPVEIVHPYRTYHEKHMEIWCCVLGKWAHEYVTDNKGRDFEEFSDIHIVMPIVQPCQQEASLAYMMGDMTLDLDSPRNTLPISSDAQEAMEDHRFTFMPEYRSVETVNVPCALHICAIGKYREMQVSFQNNEGIEHSENHRLKASDIQLWQRTITNSRQELDERSCNFLNNCRPARRYLFIHYFLSYFRAYRVGDDTFTFAHPNPLLGWKSCARPYGYARRSVVNGVARGIIGKDLDVGGIDGILFDDPTEVQAEVDIHTNQIIELIRNPPNHFGDPRYEDKDGMWDYSSDDDSREDEARGLRKRFARRASRRYEGLDI